MELLLFTTQDYYKTQKATYTIGNGPCPIGDRVNDGEVSSFPFSFHDNSTPLFEILSLFLYGQTNTTFKPKM